MIDNLMNLTGMSRSDIIDLLPFVLMEIRSYTNQYFLTTVNGSVKGISNGRIYVDKTDGFNVGDSIEILNSDVNVAIYQIKEVGDDYLITEQTLIDEIMEPDYRVVIKLAFKGVSLQGVSNMLTYSKNTHGKVGVQSQNLGGYSVTYLQPSEVGMTAYPLELYGSFNALRKLNDDYAEYWRKGYVRL